MSDGGDVFQLFEMKSDGDMRPIGRPCTTYLQATQTKYAVVTIVRKMMPENPESLMDVEAPGGVMPVDVSQFMKDYAVYQQVDGGWEQVPS